MFVSVYLVLSFPPTVLCLFLSSLYCVFSSSLFVLKVCMSPLFTKGSWLDTHTYTDWLIQSNSSMHHYECVALCKDISLQRGRFCARSLASCIPRSSEDRSSWMFFVQAVRGRPGGRLQVPGGGSKMAGLASAFLSIRARCSEKVRQRDLMMDESGGWLVMRRCRHFWLIAQGSVNRVHRVSVAHLAVCAACFIVKFAVNIVRHILANE